MCVLIDLLFLSFICFLNSFLSMNTFRVGVLNVNGARDSKKRTSIHEFNKMKANDVLFLQETHSDSTNEADWRREWGGKSS